MSGTKICVACVEENKRCTCEHENPVKELGLEASENSSFLHSVINMVGMLIGTYLIYYDAPIKPIDTVVCSYFPVEISVGMNKLLDIELHMSVCVCCTLEYYIKFVYSYKYRNYIYMFRQYGL